jgi:poly-gamma-glutamate system protein
MRPGADSAGGRGSGDGPRPDPARGRWSGGRLPRLLVATALAVTAAVLCERWLSPERRLEARIPPEVAERAACAEQDFRAARESLRRARAELGDDALDEVPQRVRGLVGPELSPLVTTLGNLDAKVLAASPDWAPALTVAMAGWGIEPGDVVAASFTGSFPGLNLAVVMACRALEVDLIAVSSVTASTWGATEPGFTWPELEARLVREGRIRAVSRAITIGGCEDRGTDLSPEGLEAALHIQRAAAAELGAEALAPRSLVEAVEARMKVFRSAAGGRPITIYVSAGGNHASLGGSPAVLRFRSGYIPAEPFDLSARRGLVARFAEQGVPSLLLLNIQELAARWGVGAGD